MDDLVQARSLELIEAEINFYKAQTANGIIETGKRLIEAQVLLGDGENFTTWLKDKVDFSRRTAYNFIRVAKEFNDVQALARLGQTKVFQLLELPADQRDEFTKINNIEEMSTRQIDSELKKWKQLANEKSEESRKLFEEKNKVESDLRVTDQVLRSTQADVKRLQEALEKERKDSKAEATELEKKIYDMKKELREAKLQGNDKKVESLQEALSETANKFQEANKKIAELENQLKEAPLEVAATKEVIVEKVPQELENELNELRKKVSELESKPKLADANIKFKVCFDGLVKSFQALLESLAAIPEEEQEKYKKAVTGLIAKMTERLV